MFSTLHINKQKTMPFQYPGRLLDQQIINSIVYMQI